MGLVCAGEMRDVEGWGKQHPWRGVRHVVVVVCVKRK